MTVLRVGASQIVFEVPEVVRRHPLHEAADPRDERRAGRFPPRHQVTLSLTRCSVR